MLEPKSVTRSNRTLAQPLLPAGGTRHGSEAQQPPSDTQVAQHAKQSVETLEVVEPTAGAITYGPRERIVAQGPDALTDVELLAVCLGSGSKQLPILQLAQGLLAQLGGLAGLFSAAPATLLQVPGLGPAKTAALLGARALGERIAREELSVSSALSNSAAVLRYAQLALAGYEQEVFACLFLDTRHRLLRCDKLFYGSVDRANVYPREILKRALTYNAAAVILAHNHPSGVAEPSSSDIRITLTIKELMTHLDVRVLDHVVVAAGGGVSMAQRGLM